LRRGGEPEKLIRFCRSAVLLLQRGAMTNADAPAEEAIRERRLRGKLDRLLDWQLLADQRPSPCLLLTFYVALEIPCKACTSYAAEAAECRSET
jgi:hypothetical protein